LITLSRSLSCSVGRGISSMLVSPSSSPFDSVASVSVLLGSTSGPCKLAKSCAALRSGESRLRAAWPSCRSIGPRTTREWKRRSTMLVQRAWGTFFARAKQPNLAARCGFLGPLDHRPFWGGMKSQRCRVPRFNRCTSNNCLGLRVPPQNNQAAQPNRRNAAENRHTKRTPRRAAPRIDR
jgi:hypothetical protein